MIAEPIAELAVPIDSMRPYDDNPRQGDVGAICTSLEANGQYRPIVVNKRDGAILAGNHTWKAAKALGWERIAATYVDVDEVTARRIVLVDNRTNDLAAYDEPGLAAMLTALADEGGPEALLGTGFDGDDLDQLLGDLDGEGIFGGVTESDEAGSIVAVAEVTLGEPKTSVAMGDVWTIDGRHLLFVVDLFAGHAAWRTELTDEHLFLPYPEPFVTLVKAADARPLLMVQPSTYLAGHLLDRHQEVRGPGSVAKR